MERETGPHGQDVPAGGGRFFMPRDSFVLGDGHEARDCVPWHGGQEFGEKGRADDERGRRYLLRGLPPPYACRYPLLRTRF